jgi:hypothetical protein
MDLWDEINKIRDYRPDGSFFLNTRDLIYRFEYNETRADKEDSLDSFKQITSIISESISHDLNEVKKNINGNRNQLIKDARGLFSDYLHSSIVANSKLLKRNFTNLFIELLYQGKFTRNNLVSCFQAINIHSRG